MDDNDVEATVKILFARAGVSSCDFAGHEAGRRAGAGTRLLLASAGADELVKLWLLDYDEVINIRSATIAALPTCSLWLWPCTKHRL